MSILAQQHYPAHLLGSTGQFMTESTGNMIKTFSYVGDACTVFAKFSLPRVPGLLKGATLTGCSISYIVTSGTLATATPTLTRVVDVNGATQATTTVALNTATPAYVLMAGSTINRPVSSVTTPAADTDAVTSTVSYLFAVTFTSATNPCTMEIQGVETYFTLDYSDATNTSATQTANYTYVNSNSGLVQNVSSSIGTVTVTLPTSASSGDTTFVMKVVGVGNAITVAPNASDYINGLGLNAAHTVNKYYTLATPAIGNSITLTADGGTGWHATTSVGTWTRQP